MSRANGHKVSNGRVNGHASADSAGRSRRALPRRLGDLVALVFERTLRMTRDPKRAALVAALVVQRALKRAGQQQLLRRLSTV